MLFGFHTDMTFLHFSWDCVYFKIWNKATFLKQSIQKNCFLRQFTVSKRMQHSRAPGPLPGCQTPVIFYRPPPLVGTICEHGSRQGVDCIWNVMAHTQKPDFVFRRKGRVHLNRQGRQFSRLQGVRISGSNAEYTMFRGSVKSTGYPLHSPVFPSLPLPCVTVCHRISTGLY